MGLLHSNQRIYPKKLFIIGNGFDFSPQIHNMKTKYIDFKQYLEKEYPDYDIDFDGFLESTMDAEGELVYDMDEVVGVLIRVLSECAGDDWSDLESCLAESFLESIQVENDWMFEVVDFKEDDDKKIRHTYYNNGNYANDIYGVFSNLRNLFEEWVFEELGRVDYSSVKKMWLHPSFKDSVFLTFNYTHTLERLYHISSNRILHIHGDAEDRNSKIYFGHGDRTKVERIFTYFGAEDFLDSLKEFFLKDTSDVLENNKSFFENLRNVNKIYSYGFSFSDVDMVYVKEICKHINPDSVYWYFNKYDINHNRENVEKIKRLGFKVRCEYKW